MLLTRTLNHGTLVAQSHARLEGGDFWHYGGLMRSVELHTMAEKPVLWRAYVPIIWLQRG
jgi:hypothetical protein